MDCSAFRFRPLQAGFVLLCTMVIIAHGDIDVFDSQASDSSVAGAGLTLATLASPICSTCDLRHSLRDFDNKTKDILKDNFKDSFFVLLVKAQLEGQVEYQPNPFTGMQLKTEPIEKPVPPGSDQLESSTRYRVAVDSGGNPLLGGLDSWTIPKTYDALDSTTIILPKKFQENITVILPLKITYVDDIGNLTYIVDGVSLEFLLSDGTANGTMALNVTQCPESDELCVSGFNDAVQSAFEAGGINGALPMVANRVNSAHVLNVAVDSILAHVDVLDDMMFARRITGNDETGQYMAPDDEFYEMNRGFLESLPGLVMDQAVNLDLPGQINGQIGKILQRTGSQSLKDVQGMLFEGDCYSSE